MDILEVFKSIKQSRKNLKDLEAQVILLWGDLYWLNSDFQSSNEAAMMEKISTDIQYDLQKYNSFISLN
jgi:hypothetical protein